MQVFYTGGVKSVSKYGAVLEGGSIQLFVWTCELINCMLLELVNVMIYNFELLYNTELLYNSEILCNSQLW